jgi:hypothetical protein
MNEFKEVDDLEVDEQLGLSDEMLAVINGYARQVGYALPQGKPTKRDRFMIALKMDEARMDPFFIMEMLSGRRIGPREMDLIMVAYAYKCGTLDRREFFKRFCVEADLLAMIGE